MKYEWKYDDLMNDALFEKTFSEIESCFPVYKEWISKLSPNMSVELFNEYIDFDESISVKLSKIYVYVALQKYKDETNETAKFNIDKIRNLSVKLEEITQKIENWLRGVAVEGMELLDDENAKRLFKDVPGLEYILTYNRLAKKHTLSEKEENILSKCSIAGPAVLSDLKDVIENEFEYELKVDGKRTKKIQTRSQLSKYFYGSEASERKAAYIALLSKYKENKEKFFLFYKGVVKETENEVALRSYKSPISIRNFDNNISDSAIDTLLKVCRDNRFVYQDYFKYKASNLGTTKLSRFDVYAPLKDLNDKSNKDKETEYTLDKALNLTLSCFKEFSEGFSNAVKLVIDSGHFDSDPKKNKTSGAFCSTVSPDVVPYVLTNYTNTLRDVSTVAHEFGHAIHSIYASNQRYNAQDATLPLAETASTFCELLVFESLLKNAKDKKERESLISDKLADSFATVLRQNYFVLFELKAHELISKGVKLEELCDVYFDLLKEQFGEDVEIDELFRYEWLAIPHIFNSPFYCYAYSFGDLLTLSLYALYKKEGKTFVPKLEKILSYGGSKAPEEILLEVGIDINKEEFWQGSFDLIKGWLKEIN